MKKTARAVGYLFISLGSLSVLAAIWHGPSVTIDYNDLALLVGGVFLVGVGLVILHFTGGIRTGSTRRTDQHRKGGKQQL